MSDELLSPRTAERLARAARAAQTLSEALWEGLHEELTDPRGGQRVAELAERLAEVSTAVASLARMNARLPSSPSRAPAGTEGDAPEVAPERPDESVEQGSRVARGTYDEPSAARGPLSPPGSFSPRESSVEDEPPSPAAAAVLVDELAPREPSEIEIRDERGERATSAWIAAIERRLERHERDGAPFAVLLVELVDVERLRHAELPGEVSRLTGLVETALADALRPADSLTRESPGRYWLLAPETDVDSATALAGRLAEAVRGAASHRGAPLRVAIGIAGCPADGSQAVALAARADIALYAARAAGRPVA